MPPTWPDGCRGDVSHGASPAHPSDLDGFAFLEDNGDRPATAGELQHSPTGFLVPLHVVLDKVYPAPFQVLTGGLAVGTAGRGIELYRLAHASSLLHLRSLILSPQKIHRNCPPDGYGLRWRRDRDDSICAP